MILIGVISTTYVLSSESDKTAVNRVRNSVDSSNANQRAARGKQSDKIPNYLVYSQDNKSFRFYDDLVRDRIVIINLMYTTCEGICPITTSNLIKVYDLLGDRVGKDVLFLSISIDQDDTPAKLKKYANYYGERKGWYYLTGNYDEIENLRRQLGLYDLDPVIDADKTQHGGLITFGNDRTNRWAALPAMMNAREIVRALSRITREKNWRYDKFQNKSKTERSKI